MNQVLSSLYVKTQALKTKTSRLSLQNMENWECELIKYTSEKPQKRNFVDKLIILLGPPLPSDMREEFAYIKMKKNNRELLTIMDQLNTCQNKLHVLLLEKEK